MNMIKWLALLLCCGCSEQNYSVDLNSTFIIDSSFSIDEQDSIVSALYDWEQVTHGIVNMKCIITNTPNLYGPLPKIHKGSIYNKEYDDQVVFGLTSHGPNHSETTLFTQTIIENNANIKSIAAHEMGHAFGLKHSSSGLMVALNINQTCIDWETLDQFCDIHHCSRNDVESNCQ